MRCRPSLLALAIVIVALSLTSGCLSLGTKNTYLQETEETKARISSLENRIGALENIIARPYTGPTNSPVLNGPE